MNLNKELNKLMKPLFVHSFRQAQRYALKGDIYDLALEIRSMVLTNFVKRFKNDIKSLKEIRSLEAYLKTSINYKTSDLRNKQNHDATLLREQKRENIDGKIEDELLNIQDSQQNQVNQLSNIQLLKKIMSEFDEESQNICFLNAKGLTSDEIAKKIGLNSNTVRTKLKRIRLRALNIRKKIES